MVTTKSIEILSEYMMKNNIPFVLTGTTALMIHGILPEDYKPDDIDVIVLLNKDDAFYKEAERLLLSLQQLAGESSNDYKDVITFRVNDVKVNAFMNNEVLHGNRYIGHFNEEGHYHEIRINDTIVCVSDVLDVLNAKFNLRRMKDYMFCKDLVSTILNIKL